MTEQKQVKVKKVEKSQEKNEKPDNIIYIGRKDFLNYITAVTTQFRRKDEVMIVARGKFISRAVDVAEAIRKKFMKDENVVLDKIKIDSSSFDVSKEDGGTKSVNVSEIEITLKK